MNFHRKMMQNPGADAAPHVEVDVVHGVDELLASPARRELDVGPFGGRPEEF